MSAVACRPVTLRLWSGFLVWLLQMVPVAFSRIMALQCPRKRGVVLVVFLFVGYGKCLHRT
jgi:hypothetical protein